MTMLFYLARVFEVHRKVWLHITVAPPNGFVVQCHCSTYALCSSGHIVFGRKELML